MKTVSNKWIQSCNEFDVLDSKELPFAHLFPYRIKWNGKQWFVCKGSSDNITINKNGEVEDKAHCVFSKKEYCINNYFDNFDHAVRALVKGISLKLELSSPDLSFVEIPLEDRQKIWQKLQEVSLKAGLPLQEMNTLILSKRASELLEELRLKKKYK